MLRQYTSVKSSIQYIHDQTLLQYFDQGSNKISIDYDLPSTTYRLQIKEVLNINNNITTITSNFLLCYGLRRNNAKSIACDKDNFHRPHYLGSDSLTDRRIVPPNNSKINVNDLIFNTIIISELRS